MRQTSMLNSVRWLALWLALPAAVHGEVAAETPNRAADNPAAVAVRPLFDDDSVMAVSLEGPVKATFADREAREERAFVLRTTTGEAPVEVRVRGKSRARICRYAPLRLDFDSDSASGTVFAGQDKLKLVLPCKDSARSERDLLEEYAAYRIFNQLSGMSYRVRLLRIRLVDTEKSGASAVIESHGFLIESDEELEARTGLAEARLPAVRRGDFDSRQAAIAFIFEYLIGNTDWSLLSPEGREFCCHNLRLFGEPPNLQAVPFDFDLSGLVDAKYARPDSSLHLSSVTQRRYRGYCIDPAALPPALAHIKSRRDAIMGVLRDLPSLTEKQIRSRERYLEDFFEEAENEEPLLEEFRKRCL